MSDPGVSDLVDEIKASTTQELSLRLATVESIETDTVTVRVAGSTNTASGVDYVDYSPKVGDTVLAFQNGPNLVIWGIPGSTGGIPTGTIVAFGSATAPAGYLLCNGQSTSGYAALAAIVGANVPNLVDLFLVGAGSAYAQGATGGLSTISLTEAQMPAHTHAGFDHSHTQPAHTHAGFNHNHSVPDHTHPQVVTDGSGGSASRNDYNADGSGNTYPQGVSTGGSGTLTTGSDGSAYVTGSGGDDNTNVIGAGNVTGSRGSGSSFDNKPPYYAVTYIIKT